jgi:SAM-dependent methyltransferase
MAVDNYQFCAEWAASAGDRTKVLDYGCGAGQIVHRLRALGIDAYGCDVFYEGGDYSDQIIESVRDRIKRMDGTAIPFADASFDLIVNNQVMEHVTDMPLALREIDRVLKPGGKVLSLFPDDTVWREGHCGIPFLHWFPRGSRIRVYYAFVCRSLGAGYYKSGMSRWKWSEHWSKWLDDWTYYRSRKEIESSFGRHFSVHFMEDYWLDKRVPRLRQLPSFVKSLIVRTMAGLVFEARKRTPD